MTNWRQPPGHPKRAEFEMMSAVQGMSGGRGPGSLSMGSNLTFRAWLPELVIPEPPEPPSLLPSFILDKRLRTLWGNDLGTGFWFSFLFFVSGLYRHWPSARLFSGRTELRLTRVVWADARALLRDDKVQISQIPHLLLPVAQNPCQVPAGQGEALGGGGVQEVWRRKGGGNCEGTCSVSPDSWVFSSVAQVPDLSFDC